MSRILSRRSGIGAVARAADDVRITPPLDAPHVDAVGVGRCQQPLREVQDEPVEVVRLRHLVREVDQLAHAPVAVRELVDRAA